MASRFTQYGGAAGGADALKQMVMERIAAELEQRKQMVENYKLGQTDRGLDLEGGRLAEDTRQFEAQAPHREAQTGYLRTQSEHLQGAPTREADSRAHDAMMAQTRQSDDLAKIKATGDQQARVAGIRTTGGDANEPLVAILGPDGRSVLVPRSQAAGKQPANAREQGRPVISGDANRVADFDTSLDDLDVLRSEVSPDDSTGILPQLGAMAPNFVTNATGFGVGAKSRQGVIDRVKQVIGKALEGGVLRKEDEYKYAKILPTISDHPDVVKTKLNDLEQAITLRRQTLLDSLGDAGYDTARYNARPARAGAKVPMVTPDGRPMMVPPDRVAEMEAKGAKRR